MRIFKNGCTYIECDQCGNEADYLYEGYDLCRDCLWDEMKHDKVFEVIEEVDE